MKDREQTSLFGVNEEKATNAAPVTINNHCISCSGNVQVVKKAFKLACLAYNSSKVDYRGEKYDRNDLLKKWK